MSKNSKTSEKKPLGQKVGKYVKLKPMEQINPFKVATVASVGLFVGAVAGFITQIAKLDFKGTEPLDPPAPNMQELEPELVLLFSKFIGPFYNLCPQRNKDKFKALVRSAIKHAEAVMLIENQLIKKEIKPQPSERNQANVHASLCLQRLRNTEKMFDSEVIASVHDTIDVIYVHLANNTANIRTLTSII